MKRTIFVAVSGMVLASCGSKSDTIAESAPPSRQGTVASAFEPNFLDSEPSLSGDGLRAVFLSGRDTERGQRIFRSDRAASGDPEPLSGDEDVGLEYSPTISPDGQFVSFAAVTEGTTHIYVASFDGASRLEVPLTDLAGVVAHGLRFSAGSPPLLAVAYETAARESALAIVKLTVASGVLSSVGVVPQENVLESETMPRWAKAGPFELVTADRRATDMRFVTRSFADATVSAVTRAEEGSGAIGSMTDASFFAAGDDRFYVAKLAHASRVVVPVGDLVAEDGTSAVGEVVVKNELRRFREGEAEVTFDSQQFNVMAVDGTSDGGVVVSMGTEYFACQHKQFYGTTLLIHNVVTKARELLMPVWDAETKTWSLTNDPCVLITEENSKENFIDASFQKMTVGGTSSRVKLVYQSYFFSDPEILELTFDWNGSAVSGAVITNLSENHTE